MTDVYGDSLRDVEAECPGFQARATARVLTRFYNLRFKTLGITAEQFSLLVGIGAAENVLLVDLADRAKIDPTTLSRSVQTLVNRGLVNSEGGRGRAGKRLALTTMGRRLMVDAFQVWKSAKNELALKMGTEKIYSARQAMAELCEATESALPSSDLHNNEDD